ncbi:hypothetical protein DsansV1_C25g0188351 [Dioscorea sansibarensis]
MSPVLRFAPSTNTGRYTFEPLLRFLISQFPPFSLPGIVLAASFAIFSHSELLSLIYIIVVISISLSFNLLEFTVLILQLCKRFSFREICDIYHSKEAIFSGR